MSGWLSLSSKLEVTGLGRSIGERSPQLSFSNLAENSIRLYAKLRRTDQEIVSRGKGSLHGVSLRSGPHDRGLVWKGFLGSQSGLRLERKKMYEMYS